MRRHYVPFFHTIVHTLWASVQVIAKDAAGPLDHAEVDDIFRTWGHRVFASGDATLTGINAERYADAATTRSGPGKPYVVMSNHQSLLDIPSIACTFPGRVRMVSKGELQKIPVWGRAMRAGGIVFVDRQDRAQSIAALDRAKAQLAAGTSIWIAPEGTRGPQEGLLPLKKGGFHLASQLGVPIAPAWITGTADIISPDSIAVATGGTVTVRYGDPVETAGRSIDEVMADVKAALLALAASAHANASAAGIPQPV
jgi:1-acyl-sn-glycerol-3-phosphate acyltransferase